MNKNITIAVLILLLMLSVLFHCNSMNSNKESTGSIITDTVVVVEIDTILVEKPIPKYIYNKEIIRDTLYTKDSIQVQVEVPITTTIYADSNYRAVVSGYRSKLDTIQVFPRHTSTTITNTVMKQKRWNVGVQAGVGYGVFNEKADMYIGLGISYTLF